jgi:glycosyltransferase involved in cell wall biosynthesis
MQRYLSIVIPAYNEANRIQRSLSPAIEYLRGKNFDSEIIVVSDGSTDRTKEVVELYKKDFENLTLINYSPNRGKGYAVKTGMLTAKGKFRLFMDADYAVPIKYLDFFLEKINDNCDIVIASRSAQQSKILEHQSFIRENLAKMFGRFQHALLKLPFVDTQCGFKLFTSTSAEELFSLITNECSYFDTELLYVAHLNSFKICEIGVEWTHDHETRLPITLGRSIDLIIKLFKIRYSKRIRIKVPKTNP